MCGECDGGGPPDALSRRAFVGNLSRLYATGLAAVSLAGVGGRALAAVDRGSPLVAPSPPKQIDVICKEAWGGEPSSGHFERHAIERLTVHHSGVPLTDNRDAPGHFRRYQSDHQALGWPDIAYHLLIDRNGHVYKGRPSWAVGDTRTSYDPAGHLLVMCDGSFSEQGISRAQVTSLVDVLAAACTRFGVLPRTIGAHRDYVSTACPGRDLYRRIENGNIRRRVHERLQAGGAEMRRLCGERGARRVRRIESGNDG